MKHIFVTVGTTEFELLTDTILSKTLLETIYNLGCKKLVIQSGRKQYAAMSYKDLTIEIYHYKDSIKEDITTADLVISHSGAGSVLETLQLKKRLLVVVNEKLMDNHQFELAEKMAEENYLYYCTCDQLNNVLLEKDFSQLKVRTPGNPKLFVDYIDDFIGISV